MNSKSALVAAFGAAWIGVVASGTALAAVRVNEVMPSNDQTIRTVNGGKGLDWIELYNDSDEAVDLTGWKMNDNPAKPSKAVLIEGDPMIARTGTRSSGPTRTIPASPPASRMFVSASRIPANRPRSSTPKA